MTTSSSVTFAPASRPVHPRFRSERAARIVVGTLVALVLVYGFS